MRHRLGWVVLSSLGLSCGTSHHGDGGTGPDAPAASCTADSCPTGDICSASGACIPAGTCAVDADCMPGIACVGTMCQGCQSTHLDLSYVAPNFMFAIDRSCSMTQVIGGSTTKWEAAVAAVQHVLANYGSDIRWGATLFPDTTGSACTQDAIPFPIGSNTAPLISDALGSALGSNDPLYPDNPCVTNIDTGIEQAATDPALADPTRDRFIMLITDGGQSGCSAGGSNAGTEAAITALLGSGVKTFVVGFGSAVNQNALNKFAADGGEAGSGSNKYYEADTADALDTVFESIAQQIVSCEYLVSPAPADLDETYVYFSGSDLVPRDPTHTSGWDYDSSTDELTFYGSDCTALQSFSVTQVDVISGCPIQ